MFLTIWHEPEDQVGGAGSARPADYAAMYRYVVTELRSLGVTNAVFVMNYMGFNGWSNMVDALYPGNDVVDWIAYDPYGFKMHTDFGQFLDTANETAGRASTAGPPRRPRASRSCWPSGAST